MKILTGLTFASPSLRLYPTSSPSSSPSPSQLCNNLISEGLFAHMRCPTLWTTWWSSKKGRQICRLSYLGGCKGELQGPSERREGRQTEMEGCNVLVTGGLGFIGSHTVVPLLKQGCNVMIL